MTVSLAGLLGFVVIALIVMAVAWGLTIVVGRSPFDPAIKQIVTWAIFAVAVIVVLYALLSAVGLVAGGPILVGK